jgi:hypothetical protein
VAFTGRENARREVVNLLGVAIHFFLPKSCIYLGQIRTTYEGIHLLDGDIVIGV